MKNSVNPLILINPKDILKEIITLYISSKSFSMQHIFKDLKLNFAIYSSSM